MKLTDKQIKKIEELTGCKISESDTYCAKFLHSETTLEIYIYKDRIDVVNARFDSGGEIPIKGLIPLGKILEEQNEN